MKLILLDIDNTTFNYSEPRPYLKEFIIGLTERYEVGFYTAADKDRLMYVLRYLYFTFRIDDDIVHSIQRHSLSYETCPMVFDTAKNIEYKCLRKAWNVLGTDYRDILLLDDMPMHDNPDLEQRLQVPGFYGDQDDTYLRDLVINF